MWSSMCKACLEFLTRTWPNFLPLVLGINYESDKTLAPIVMMLNILLFLRVQPLKMEQVRSKVK